MMASAAGGSRSGTRSLIGAGSVGEFGTLLGVSKLLLDSLVPDVGNEHVGVHLPERVTDGDELPPPLLEQGEHLLLEAPTERRVDVLIEDYLADPESFQRAAAASAPEAIAQATWKRRLPWGVVGRP